MLNKSHTDSRHFPDCCFNHTQCWEAKSSTITTRQHSTSARLYMTCLINQPWTVCTTLVSIVPCTYIPCTDGWTLPCMCINTTTYICVNSICTCMNTTMYVCVNSTMYVCVNSTMCEQYHVRNIPCTYVWTLPCTYVWTLPCLCVWTLPCVNSTMYVWTVPCTYMCEHYHVHMCEQYHVILCKRNIDTHLGVGSHRTPSFIDPFVSLSCRGVLVSLNCVPIHGA